MSLSKLKDLPNGEKVFADSNILTYHLIEDRVHGPTCREFIHGVEEGRFNAFITPIVVSETLFNFIKAKVVKDYLIKPRDVASMIKARPGILTDFSVGDVSDLFEIFYMLPLGNLEVKEALDIIPKFSLLTNDALNVAAMRVNRITSIASNDKDMLRVDGITTWMP